MKALVRRLWIRHRSLLFERVAGAEEVSLPAEVEVRAIRHRASPGDREALTTAGAGEDLRYLRNGVTAYVLYRRGQPVGVGWCFRDSRLLRRLRYPLSAVYLGGFHVVESARGQGLYPLLLRYICREVRNPAALVVVQAVPQNVASCRGLSKAGFRVKGELEVFAICGVFVRCRVWPVAETSRRVDLERTQ